MNISATTRLAGVVGAPVRHSLSPAIHNAWIAATGLDAAYVAFPAQPERFRAFIDGLRGGVIAGLNVTIPFKEQALALADAATDRARAAGAANLLVFAEDGAVSADNTDGLGLIAAFAEQAPSLNLAGAVVTLLGAGGAARGAAIALRDAGVAQVRIVNRTPAKARAILDLGVPGAAYAWDQAAAALDGAAAAVNATSLGLADAGALELPWSALPPEAVVMDMVYKPLRTGLLRHAASRGHAVVDGLAMLIGQARPSFEAFFGRPPPDAADVRGLALKLLGETP